MSPCPPLDQLRQLLAEQRSSPDLVALEAHVEGCAACQRALEQLIGATEFIAPEGRDRPTDDQTAMLSGLRPPRKESGADFLRRLEVHPPTGALPPAGLDSVASARTISDDAAPGSPRGLPVVPGYEVLGELGRGGMGVVYKAWQVRLHRVVALKMVLAGAHASPEAVARLRIEAEAVGRLQHPNIVQIYEVGEVDGRPFFSMEYVDGGSLAARLAGTPTPADQAARFVEVLARAVHAAHQKGIVHRDLTPANVLLVSGGGVIGESAPGTTRHLPLTTHQPKITDFGLAKLMIGGGESRTQTGAVMGTPSYMAPEQARGRTPDIGPAADVYSLGALLYELLAGRPPFKGASVLETLEQVCSTEPVSLRQLQPRLPRDLETICLKCLEKEPTRRYPTAEALADELARFTRHEPIQARPVGRLGRLRRWCRRNPALAAATGLAAAALVAVAVVSVSFGVHQYRAATRLNRALKEAEARRREVDRLAAGLTLDRGLALCNRGDVDRGLLWLAHALELAGRADAPGLEEVIRANLTAWRRQFHPLRGLLEHRGWVEAVAFSPDGRRAATASLDRTARLWDVATGRPVGPPLEHRGKVSVAVFDRTGAVLLTADERAAYLWDGATGKALRPPLRDPAGVRCAALSPDGKMVLTGGTDGAARLWDADSGTSRVLTGHRGPVAVAAFSAGGRLALTGGDDGTVRLWETATGRPLEVPPLRHQGPILAAAFGPDGKRVATAGQDETAGLWDPLNGRMIARLRHAGPVTALAFSPAGARLATASRDRTARIWDAATGAPAGPPLPHESLLTAVAFSPDGRLLLTASKGSRARVWDVVSGTMVHGPLPHQGAVQAVAFHPAGTMALTAGHESAARLWEIVRRDESRTGLAGTGELHAIAFSPDGKLLAAAGIGPAVPLWQVATGRSVGSLEHAGAARVRAVAFSRDGRLLVTGGDDHTARLWQAATRQELSRFPHSGKVTAVALSPDGKTLLTGTMNRVLSLWDVDSGKLRTAFEGHRGPVYALAFSPDGRTFVSGSSDLTARLWETAGGKPVGRPLRHQGPVWAAAFSPDGAQVATGSTDKTVRFWDAATGRSQGRPLHVAGFWPQEAADRPAALPRFEPDAVRSLVYSPDGLLLMVGTWGANGQLWDVATRKPVGVPLRHRGAVLAGRFTGAGHRVWSAAEDRTARAWDVPGPVAGKQERLCLWVQTATGLELDAGGGVRLLDAAAWHERQRRLQELGGPPP